MNTHVFYQELISRLLDEAISPEENALLQEHLSQCAECRAVYAAFSALSESVGGELEEPPERLRANVMAELRREEIQRKNRRPGGWIGFVAAVAAVALIFVTAPRLLKGPAEIAAAPKMAAAYTAGAGDTAAAPLPEPREVPEAEESVAYDQAVMRTAETNSAAANDLPSMDALLAELNGKSVPLTLDELALQPLYLIQTAEGVLEIYRYEGSLYYIDPYSSLLCQARCSEEDLIGFLQN